MKKMLITLTVMLAAAALIVVFCGPAMAKVSGRCDNCHTMHNSQDGATMATDRSSWYPETYTPGTPPYGTLLTDTCVGCHSHATETKEYDLGGSYVPVVYTRSGTPATHLAGGNFAYVETKGDAYGHNVLGISTGDTALVAGAPGNAAGCGGVGGGCHNSLAVQQFSQAEFGSGCQGCHFRPAHHANDHTNHAGGLVNSEAQGWYRFLSGHMGSTEGVHGYEDGDWQATTSATDHNEYLGVVSNFQSTMPGISNHTTTAYCCGCHGNFHAQNEQADGSGDWLRHPSDAVIPNTGEYSDAYGAGGTGSGSYDPLVPVARQTLPASPSASVQLSGTNPDMVMCLSCHRPHGSPYADILRWDYQGDCDAGGSAAGCGCMKCHTQKGT